MKKDNTFKVIGIFLAIVIPVVLLVITWHEDGILFSDAMLSLFALLVLEFLCFLGHKAINKK